ncbi:MAG: hypothetical protein ABIW34_07280 [Ginsengibacter sp.]
MKIISIIFTVITIMFTANAFAQHDIVRLMIGTKVIGETIITDNAEPVSVNKLKYKKVSDLTVVIKQNTINKIYKRTLQITDENESLLFSVDEQKTKVGLYKINLTKVRKQLLQQDIIRVFLAEDPANSMMRIPSKRKLLTELHLR